MKLPLVRGADGAAIIVLSHGEVVECVTEASLQGILVGAVEEGANVSAVVRASIARENSGSGIFALGGPAAGSEVRVRLYDSVFESNQLDAVIVGGLGRSGGRIEGQSQGCIFRGSANAGLVIIGGQTNVAGQIVADSIANDNVVSWKSTDDTIEENVAAGVVIIGGYRLGGRESSGNLVAVKFKGLSSADNHDHFFALGSISGNDNHVVLHIQDSTGVDTDVASTYLDQLGGPGTVDNTIKVIGTPLP